MKQEYHEFHDVLWLFNQVEIWRYIMVLYSFVIVFQSDHSESI